ncbi:DUF2914 domain-containing protein [Flocculibacter collagenilyticus]|uniref:DUF2914 domain-containing protein n=1 Tax=Flocculibacter collagenilyticus TaxID=2744479 RepID=UPI0018F7653C|nr:DUF2914 domain-containing protein [Flocculibacter collagenilyticus]
MADNQLKITVALKSADLTANTLAEQPDFVSPKPPFSKVKVISAVVCCLLLAAAALYFLPFATPLDAKTNTVDVSAHEQTATAIATVKDQSAVEPAASQPISQPNDSSGETETETDSVIEKAALIPATLRVTPKHPATKEIEPDQTATATDEAITLTHPAELVNPDTAIEKKQTVLSNTQSTHVARAVLTNKIVNREPQEQLNHHITSNNAQRSKLFFFTELHNLAGHTVRHRWIYKGNIVADVPLTIKSNRWRTYSSKSVNQSQPEQWLGQWAVQVVDEDNHILISKDFIYKK